MKIAVIADAHARGKDLKAFKAQWSEAIRIAISKGVKHILVAGDMFDRPNISDRYATVGDIVEAVVEPISFHTSGGALEVTIHVISGNHDMSNASQRDALEVLKMVDSVEVYQSATPVNLGEGVHAVMLPWEWKPGCEDQIRSTLSLMDIDPGEKVILCAHLQVLGAYVGGREVEHGSYAIGRSTLEALPFDRFFLGDFHNRQDLTNGRGGYVGALRQMNHGEEGHQQGFEIWDSETNEVQWIELEKAPTHRTVLVQKGDVLPIPGPNEILRIRPQGFTLEDDAVPDNVTIAPVVEEKEIQARVEVAEGLINSNHGLLDLWYTAQPLKPNHTVESLHETLTSIGSSDA